MIRNIQGYVGNYHNWGNTSVSGPLYLQGSGTNAMGGTSAVSKSTMHFNASRSVPVGLVNRPKSYGVLACIYLGK